MIRCCRGALPLALALLLGACAGSGVNRAQTEFDAGRYEQAAVQFAALSQDPSAAEEARHVAELRLALSLQRLGLRATGAALLKNIAGRPEHAARRDAFRALLPLALELPSAANIEAPLLQFDQEGREAMMEGLPAAARSRVRFLVGRFEYENADYERAIAQLQKVEGKDLARAQMLIALCHVQMRKSVPAAAALDRALTAAAALPAPESGRLADQASLLKAQVFFTASIRKGESERTFGVNGEQAAAALKYWKKIDGASPLGAEAEWQRAWIELATGDDKAALADVRSAVARPGAYVPEAEQLEAILRWRLGEKDAAMESLRAFVKKYTAVRDALKEQQERVGKEAEPDAAALALLARASAHPEELPETPRLAVAHALGDRRVLEYIEYDQILQKESALLESLPALPASAAAPPARKALEGERKAMAHRAAQMVRDRLARAAKELEDLLASTEEALSSGP